MKKIKFNKLVIKNFRNITELEINFNDTTTEISGKNGLGKTNTLSAMMWCLFGKDINDVKQFPISPIIDGKEDNSIQTVVKMVVNDNYVIERSYHKRTSSLKTGWIIDGKEELVSITQTNYAKELQENLVDEETFKSLSNINYIPNLHWKDLKKLIFDLIGEVRDEEVLFRGDFTLVEEHITKFGIEQAQKLIQDTDKELSEDIKRLETEYQTLLNTKEKYVADEKETLGLEERKNEIEDKLYAIQQETLAFKEKSQKYLEMKNNIESLENRMKMIINQIEFTEQTICDYDKLYKENNFDVEQTRLQEVAKIELQIKNLLDEKERTQRLLKDLESNLSSIKNQGTELKQKKIKVENDTCSTCGQKLPEEKINEVYQKLQNEQLLHLTRLKEEFEETKQRKTTVELSIPEINEKIENLEIEKEQTLKFKKYDVVETDKQKQIRVAKEQKELDLEKMKTQLYDMQKEYGTLQAQFGLLEMPEAMVDESPYLRQELNDINNKLATTITLKKLSDDVEKTYSTLQTKRENKMINKQKMQQIISFNNVKADLLKEKVRFYFDLVSFKTKDYTQSGEEVETFKLVNDKGVEWKDINTGNKILIGIDLLQGIMKAKECFVPIIIDNFETLTTDVVITNTQLITAKAVKNIEKLEVK